MNEKLIVYYRAGVHCPGCDGRNWWVRSVSAECARCGCALPLAPKERPNG